VGLYGKLPSHGDFLRRRVSDRFVDVWDGWLQECFAASRDVLGDRWLDVYLTSPAWRFAAAAGVFDDQPMLGLMVPSVDRVGRYFHLAVVAALTPERDVITTASAAEPFFAAAERLLIDTLASTHVDFNAFDRDVMNLAGDLAACTLSQPAGLEAAAAGVLAETAAAASWQVPMADVSELTTVLAHLSARRIAELYDPVVLWWTSGSSEVEPSCLLGRGLPQPPTFAALLDGAWVGWSRVAREEPPPPDTDVVADDPTPPRFRSAGATNVGRVRTVNQDAYVERSEVGIWVVADGLGGHEDGEVASRMVCDGLVDFVPPASFEETIQAAGERIREVNAHLVRAAEREHVAMRSGSTVVALLTRGTRCAILWAGDSRAYRLRGGRLDQLTQDHSLPESEGGGNGSTAITRAVGAEKMLELDVYRDRVRPGDRFLLCSDGLTRVLPEDRIQTSMAVADPQSAVEALVAGTLAAGAPDNVTAVIVDAYTDA
jgi:type VI secretion system protein ImpM